MLRVLDLFSGIGGFTLGLESTGHFKTVCFCEIKNSCRARINKHWPGVPILKDIRDVDGYSITETIDVICGGFPCQDISLSGKMLGPQDGRRSSLYKEMLRIIDECRPRYAIIENVPSLLSGGGGAWFSQVLYDISAIGYDAEWHCLPASFIGADHRRERVWIIAYPNGTVMESLEIQESLCACTEKPFGWESVRAIDACLPADDYARMRGTFDGVRDVMDRLESLGNSVVPQVVAIIATAIIKHERAAQ